MAEKSQAVKGLTRGVLLALGAGAVIGIALVFPVIGWIYKEFKKEQWEEAKRRGRLRNTLRRLEKQKLISWRETDGELTLNLTEKGKKKVLHYNIDSLQIKNRKIDGRFRVIIFDIPEKKKIAREIFRGKLKGMGFKMLQRSVFITPYKCKDEIDFLRHALEISPFVTFLEVTKIEGGNVKDFNTLF